MDGGEGYKYLGLLDADGVKDSVMKEGLGEEHIGRIKKFLKSKLNGVNTISAINSRAVAVITYIAGVMKWTKEELQNLQSRPKVAGTLELDHVSPIPKSV